MSPLVQRARNSNRGEAQDADQHWTMLLFESASAGVFSVTILLLVVMSLVGVYVIIVWPLTQWDLTGIGLEKCASLVNVALWSVFGGGMLAGLYFFSGVAFKEKRKNVAASTPARRVR